MAEMLRKKRFNSVVNVFFAVLMFVVTYNVISRVLTEPSDYNLHMTMAQRILSEGALHEFFNNSYPMWHLSVALVMKFLGASPEYSAAIVTGLFNVLTYVVVSYALRNMVKINASLVSLLSFLLLLVGPLYLPWYKNTVYYGQGTPNIWHNPTSICVRAFVLMAFLQVVKIIKLYEEGETVPKKDWIILTVLSFLGTLAKPVLPQILIPGIGLYLVFLLISSKGKSLLFSFKMAATFIPTVALVAVQFVISFFISAYSDGGIEFGISEGWKSFFSPNPVLLPMLALIFPIYILIVDYKNLKTTDVKLVIFTFISGLLEAALIQEVGARKLDGNFLWGYMLAMFLLYFVTFKNWILYTVNAEDSKKNNILIAIGWICFFIQLFIGIYYASTFTNL